MQIFRFSILCSYGEMYTRRRKIFWPSESIHLELPSEKATSMEKLSRGLTSKKTEFRQKFYRCKYSFWFRPSPVRITHSTPSIRNNWPSADPHPRDDTSQITEFQTRPSNFHLFFPAMQWKYCTFGVPGRYYGKIRKSARVLRPKSQAIRWHMFLSYVCAGCC